MEALSQVRLPPLESAFPGRLETCLGTVGFPHSGAPRSRSIFLCAFRPVQKIAISVVSFRGRLNRAAEYDAACLESWPSFSRPPVINGRTPTRSSSPDQNPMRLVYRRRETGFGRTPDPS